MASLKDVQNKIAAVKKTKQITKAMNMVATSRLRGAQGNMENFRPYASKFSEVLGSLAQKSGEEASPLLVPREEVKKIHVVLCTSDRGLCGGFNVNLIDKAQAFVKQKKGDANEISFTILEDGDATGAGRKNSRLKMSTSALSARPSASMCPPQQGASLLRAT